MRTMKMTRARLVSWMIERGEHGLVLRQAQHEAFQQSAIQRLMLSLSKDGARARGVRCFAASAG
jgi:hypothetical protein